MNNFNQINLGSKTNFFERLFLSFNELQLYTTIKTLNVSYILNYKKIFSAFDVPFSTLNIFFTTMLKYILFN